MQVHTNLFLVLLVLTQKPQMGSFQGSHVFVGCSLPCRGSVIEAPPLNDTIQPNTVLFSIDGLIDLQNCTVKDYFKVQNETVVLEKQLSDYCGDLKCVVSCNTGIPVAKPETINLNLVIERFSNYTIQFSEPVYRINVTEAVSVGTYVFNQGVDVSIRECNTGALSSMGRGFKLINNSELFEWTPETNNNGLKVKSDIDYEKVQTVNLMLQASLKDGQTLVSTATTKLEIDIQDIDDTPPIFEYSVYTVDIQEKNLTIVNKTFTVQPSYIHAFDQDRGIDEEIVYSIIVNPSGLFVINSTTGEVHVTSMLDREDHGHYTVIIRASQKNKDYSSATASLIVNVTDIDDHLPKFSPDKYAVTLSEHSATGTYITKVTAFDDDMGANAQFTYKLSNDSIPVDIDGLSGILSVKNQKELDREKFGDKIEVEVYALTYDNRASQNNATVTIQLDDINDHNPTFGNTTYHFPIGNIPGTGVIGQVSATDVDKGPNSNVTYSFMEGTQTQTNCQSQQNFPFKVDELTGYVSLVSSPPVCSRYSCFVRGCDNPTDASSRRCALTEIVISASTTQNTTGVAYPNQTLEMFENMGKDKIVGLLKCTGSKYSYSGDSQLLYVNNQGLLMAKTSLDREENDTHTGVVTVEDSNGDTVCQVRIKVIVRDTNDHAPDFTQDDYSFYIPDDYVSGNAIGNVKAFDNDTGANAEIAYSIKHSGDFDIFRLNTSSGTIYIDSLSKLTKDIYQLLVSATDNGTPRLESVASVYIMKSTGENNTVPITSPLPVTEINERKHRLESAMSSILNLSVTISRVQTAANHQVQHAKSVLYIAALKKDSTHVSRLDLQRVVLMNYEAIRALFYEDTHDDRENSPDNGLRAPEIALIVMAGVILIGAIVAIIIISKQFSSHKKYRRLYENLTRNSSIYESQEIKVNMDEETSDYNGSLNTQELEGTLSDPSVACINPLFDGNLMSENDSGNVSDANQDADGITNRNRTDSEQALESLARLSDMLDKEDREPNLEGISPVSSLEPATTDAKVTTGSQDDDTVTNELTSSTPNTPSMTEQQVAENDTNVNDLIEQTQASKEPNPDYDVKQVRFNAEVLDTDDNKFEPLKENENGRKYPKRIINRDENKLSAISNDEVNSEGADDMEAETPIIEQINDEPGWVEEEINIPSILVKIDSVSSADLVSTHF